MNDLGGVFEVFGVDVLLHYLHYCECEAWLSAMRSTKMAYWREEAFCYGLRSSDVIPMRLTMSTKSSIEFSIDISRRFDLTGCRNLRMRGQRPVALLQCNSFCCIFRSWACRLLRPIALIHRFVPLGSPPYFTFGSCAVN